MLTAPAVTMDEVFNISSVALVGASPENPFSFAGATMHALKEAGFPMKKIQFFSSNDETKHAVYLKSKKTCDCKFCKEMRKVR